MAFKPLSNPFDPKATDPPLLAKHSVVKQYKTRRFTYPGVRVFYRRLPKLGELPTDPAPLPLLVFIHGLGGSVAQFHPLMTSLSNSASCLAVDLPGCGRSAFAPTTWGAYATDALVDLLELIIDNYRDKEHSQGVILVGHSMGTVLAARIANKQAPHTTDIASHVLGVIGICPVSGPPSKVEVAKFRRLLWIPTWIFNLWRWIDQWGGPQSASVTRFVGSDADLESRQLQDRFNKQSRTPVFRRMAWGSLPKYVDGQPTSGLFGEATWAGLDIPVCLVGGQNDTIVSPKEVDKIANILESCDSPDSTDLSSSSHTLFESATPVVTRTKPQDHLPESIDAITADDFVRKDQLRRVIENSNEEPTTPRDPETPNETLAGIPPQPLHPAKVVKTKILPAPATHALLFTPHTVYIVSALIRDFLSDHITRRLDLGWQLQYLSREGKWDVKNLAKWKGVRPVSEPIHGIFRAMKTLREVDEEHSPKEFTAKWGWLIKDIIDISHDDPVYDYHGLEREGIKYHKFPTVSKIPPTDEEVEGFIAMVDRIREDQDSRANAEGWAEYAIGVHCHYGYNRTGYFVVCYLVERCDLSVDQALETFKGARPNGIRHSHFIDKLSLRYSGLEK